MSESDDPQFLDTNILIYAFDVSTGRKHEVSNAPYTKFLTENLGCTSLQILQEFFVSVAYKSPKKLGGQKRVKLSKTCLPGLFIALLQATSWRP
jgi:predicted nucleic acid-binding protein